MKKFFFFHFIALLLIGSGNGRILSKPKTSSHLNSTTAPNLLCKDGRGPLLEGDDRIFPCIEECPDGFICENTEEGQQGICCPDLEILYELYGSSEEETTESLEAQKKEEFQPVILKDDPVTTTTLASKKPNIIVKTTTTTTAPKTQEKSIKTKSTKISGVKAVVREHPDKDILSTIKLTDIRRAEEKKKPVEPIIPYENNEQAQNLKQDMLTKTSNLDKLLIPTIAKKYLELENFETPMKPLADFGYTCRREKFEIKCKNGTVDTQIVLRWFVKDDMCCSYPYGFCPGETIMADRTIRSKEECESLCLRDGIGFQSEELDGIMKELDSQKKFPSESIESAEKNKSLHIEAAKSADNKSETGIDVSNNTQSQNQTSAENGNENFDGNVKKNAAALIHGGNFAMSVEGKKPGPKKSCIREHFRAMCPDGMPSQFTIRWFVKGGMCCAYPYGYCHGESVYEEEVIRTKDECDAYCLGNEGKDLKGLRI